VSLRDRTELTALLKRVEGHRKRIRELQEELALLMQKIARVGSRTKSDEGTRKGGPPRRYKLAAVPVPHMSDQPCQVCGKAAQIHAESPEYVTHLHFRCAACGAVWILDRSNRTNSPRLVAQRTPSGK
jgi:hypothetical protein